jgi:hypothetical protein
VNISANIASSAILLKMVLTSSRVIGGPCDDLDDESEAKEVVRSDEPDGYGGIGS